MVPTSKCYLGSSGKSLDKPGHQLFKFHIWLSVVYSCLWTFRGIVIVSI